jgi:hypothetical protein
VPDPISLRDDLAAGFGGADTDPPAPDTGVTDTSAPEGVSGEPVALEPPKHWADADRGLFTKAPREIQQRWLSREDEVQKGFSKHGQELAAFKKDRESFDEIFGNLDQELQLNGLSRPQFVKQLVAWNDFIARDPVTALRQLAGRFKVDLKTLTENPASTTDPQVRTALSKIDELANKLTAREQSDLERAREQRRAAVEEFATAKGADGKPLRPYFDDVAEDVARLLRADRRLSLDTAYNKALRINDAVWEKEQAAKAKADADKKLNEQKGRVDKARRASVGSSGEGNGAAKPKTLREELEQQFAGGIQ